VFALGDALLARGWHPRPSGPADSLHSTVSNSNTGVIDVYLRDLRECVAEIAGRRVDDRSTSYSTVE
jgi:sphinganine-1-phosphate aldolase